MKTGRSGPTDRYAGRATAVEVQIDDPAWRQLGPNLVRQIRRAVRLALTRTAKRSGGLTVLLTGNDRVQALNRTHRGKDGPTNVLSFPASSPDYLGDIAIAYGVTAREAEAGGLAPVHHALHLTVHGVLHLLGYDHERSKDAEIMETLEADILAEMDIPNPYLRRGCAA